MVVMVYQHMLTYYMLYFPVEKNIKKITVTHRYRPCGRYDVWVY